jgi:hypothetical protein
MAARGRTPAMSDDFDRGYDSSPDPLALSFNENKPKSTRKATPRNPLVTTSPSKQNRQSSVSEFEFSSPSKAMVMNTPRMGSASPWRIKVTVQAEPGSDEENAQSPTVNRFSRTQTTTVPLKDADASSPVKRGRGRPRKSEVGATPKAKRAGTPAKRAAASRLRDTSVGAADASAADIDTDAPPKRKRGRPRKSIQPPTEDQDMLQIEVTEAHSTPAPEMTPAPATKSKASTSQKSTRFATPQVLVPDIQTTDATPQPPASMLPQDKVQVGTQLTLPADRRRRNVMAQYEMPVVDTPPKTELGQRLRARKSTPHSKKMISVSISSDEESEQNSDVLTPASGDDEIEPRQTTQDPFTSRTSSEEFHVSRADAVELNEQHMDEDVLAGSEDSLHDEPFEDDNGNLQDATNFAFDEGTTRMPDDTTVIDSENFSMISVDSLPSNGGLTSPARPEESIISTKRTGSMLKNEYLPSVGNTPNAKEALYPNIAAGLSRTSPKLKPNEAPSRPAFRRYVTPVIDAANPSVPPVMQPVPEVLAKTETPRLGRVVTAGVALQGLLDPSRLTPEPSQNMLDGNRDRLDDLFRGFSEGTRRDLQAGLRLGEQLAQGQSTEQSPAACSSPIKSQPEPEAETKGASSNQEVEPKGNVLKTHRKFRQPRLLTPEDQENDVVTAPAEPEVIDVQYPSLNARTELSLPSPGGSDDEMSWRVDTPPAATENTERMRVVGIDDQPKESPAVVRNTNQPRQDDYSDIWQEEASRSSNLAGADEVPVVQDIFEPGPAVPTRGKLSRTWRRESGNNFQYSDEVEPPEQLITHQEVLEDHTAADAVEQVSDSDEDAASDDSDDTGMFFQSNMPHIFSKRHSRDLKQKKADKLNLTLLMNEGESLAPESSPPVVIKKSSSGTKTNPFLNTPPRFTGHLSSPSKSSPLRRELRGSDISSTSQSLFQEESSLPLPPSSPFRTFVDGETLGFVVPSDERQLQMEMGEVTDSSIRLVRNEANEYLDAYEPLERSLDEIEEVTEPSRTWHRNTSIAVSSPPKMKTLSPVRKRNALFEHTPAKKKASPMQPVNAATTGKSKIGQIEASSGPAHHPSDAAVPCEATSQERPTGLLTRMTSTLWSAVTRPAPVTAPTPSPPAPHPILAKLSPLPKIEPWTKTHYKTLDKLYAVNQKHPAFFSPSIASTTSLARTNTHLLDKFLAANPQPYVGAVFTAWGYEFDMTAELVVLCQVFCELMRLESIEAYEKLKGREIEMGECMPGKTGERINGEEVVRRLATVILGEEVRADERRGEKIDRSRVLEIRWPHE